jgi:hypothetical protein
MRTQFQPWNLRRLPSDLFNITGLDASSRVNTEDHLGLGLFLGTFAQNTPELPFSHASRFIPRQTGHE